MLVLLAGVFNRGMAQQTTVSLYALPETSAAATYVSTITAEALPTRETFTVREKIALSLIEAGFLIGTTTAVHELGHASRVRAMGGESRWETGDQNWWSYLTHRVPLVSGVTEWMVPRIISADERILIATAGFNATTQWDENVGGEGPFLMLPARYSTLVYAFAGVSSDADDLGQLVGLYAEKGFRIGRYELQAWQLLAGCIGELNTKVKAYAYFTPRGVSLRAVTRIAGWSVATEAVVHGRSQAEVELGRRMKFGSTAEFYPKVLVSPRGLGGSLQAAVHVGPAALSLKWQRVPAETLLSTRAVNSFDLQLAARF